MTPMICKSNAYEEWRGETGNYFLLILFIVALVLNTFGSVFSAFTNKNKSNFTIYLVIEMMSGNILISFSQILTISIELSSKKTCFAKVFQYLTHQTGMLVSSVSLLSITVLHYRLVAQLFPLEQSLRQKNVKRLVAIQSIAVVIGVIFIVIPLLIPAQFAYALAVIFKLVIDIVAIVYCWKSRKVLKRTATSKLVTARNVNRLKREANWIQPATAVTAFLMFLSLIVNVPRGLKINMSRMTFIVLKWISMSYYVSLILLVIIYLTFRKETRRALVFWKRNKIIHGGEVMTTDTNTSINRSTRSKVMAKSSTEARSNDGDYLV